MTSFTAFPIPTTLLGSATLATTAGNTALSLASRFASPVNVKDFGAKGDGVTDDTAAINSAVLSAISVQFPPGTYKVNNLTIANQGSFELAGQAGPGGVFITSTSSGPMITFSNCNFSLIRNFKFTSTTTSITQNGLLFNSNTDNTEVRGCLFSNLTGAAMSCQGSSGTPLSGNKVYHCWFIGNSANAGVGQLDCSWNNDFFIENNQFGSLSTSTSSSAFSGFGINLQNCSDGFMAGNAMFFNEVGANLSGCNSVRFVANRIEQSRREGAIFNTGTGNFISNNWFNDNGQEATNTFNQCRLQAMNDTAFEVNIADDDTGNNTAKFAYSVENTCLRTTLRGNIANNYATGAWNLDSSESFTSLTPDLVMPGFSGTTVVTSGSSTVFLGPCGQAASFGLANQVCPIRHTAVQLWATCSSAPGAGQTFTYQLLKGGSAVGASFQISGNAAFSNGTNYSTTVIEDSPNNAQYSVSVVLSSAAGSAAHQAQIVCLGR